MKQKNIEISQRYKSSTRIDSDSFSYQNFVDNFILHGTAVNVLDTISRDFSGSEQRAYTLTGPYGSGKSTVALFLSSLLSTNSKERDYAAKKLVNSNGTLNDFQTRFGVKNGWSIVKHVCGLEAPANSILVSIYNSLKISFDVNDIKQLNDEQCLQKIKIALEVDQKNYDGVILLLDEMGKALDFQSRSNQDLHLFQSLADICQQAKTPVVLIGFLHQAFIDYAKNKDARAQDEWAKVQGRYRDLSFNPSIDESLVLIGDSITKSDSIEKQLDSNFSSLVNCVANNFLDQNRNISALTKTLPIDPLVSLLLGPISRRRFSQNERSLFGFLASHEKYGFKEFLEKAYTDTDDNLQLYHPELFWDYLHHNLHHLIVTSNDSKAWLEGCDSIYRADQKGGQLHVLITKVVSLLTIFGFHHHLHASRAFLTDYFSSRGFAHSEVKSAIDDLEFWTVLIFRQKHNALFVFQGSDIDIHSKLLETIEVVSEGAEWTSVCDIPQNILGTAHYHQTGTMRWAKTQFVNKIDKELVDSLNYEPVTGEAFLNFILPAISPKKEIINQLSGFDNVVIGSVSSVESLKLVAIELIALRKISREEEKIKHDLIAQKELSNRIIQASKSVEQELIKLFNKASWKHKESKLNAKSLTEIVSKVADRIFSINSDSSDHLPLKIVNELVNRSKPSGSANSAIRKLMNAMLTNADQEDLGFKKDAFPPEKGIYLSCLKSKGWHCRNEEGFGFPSEWSQDAIDLNPDMHALWLDGVNFIKQNNKRVVISELYARWMKAPFGLTSGLCRLYGLALLKSLEGKVAFYDLDSTKQFIFIPELDEELITKIYKHPDEAGVRYYEISEIQTHLLDTLAKATIGDKKQDDAILSIAKHIVKIVHKLPTWVKKTSGDSFIQNSKKSGLTKEARALRNKVISANDPYKLILDDLPNVFGLSKEQEGMDSKLAQCLKTAIEDLSAQHDMLLSGFKQIVTSSLSAKFDNDLKKRCEQVIKAAQRPNVKELALRIAKFIDNKAKFEPVINLATGVPEKNWTDKHLRNGLDELQNLCVQFRRIESFGKLNKDSASKPLAFITADAKGNYQEFTAYVNTDAEADKSISDKTETLKASIKSMPKDQQLVVLSNLLTSLMEPTEMVNIDA